MKGVLQMIRKTSYLLRCVGLLLCLAVGVLPTLAQQTAGNLRGTVKDPSGAVVAGATVTLTDKATNTATTIQTTGDGEYQFNNILPGDYTVTIEASNFKKLTLNNVRVELNQTTDVPSQLQIGLASEVVEVSAAGAELVETTSSNLTKSFGTQQVVELAQTSVGSGVNNLALIAPNVASSGGVGVGSGGSIGGQRPRNNNFMVDGVDNNDKSVTGPQIYVSPETVAEFSLIANQFSAEFGRSNGGQFLTITKSGTNDFHGSAYGFFRNRYLNALDARQKEQGFVRERSRANETTTFFLPRSDYGRAGFNIGGPMYLPAFGEGGPTVFSGKDKLFFFTSYERLQTGAASPPGGIAAPTAAGLAAIQALPGISATNLAIFRQFVPVAPANNAGTIDICRTVPDLNGQCTSSFVAIPVGTISFASPSFTRQNNFVLNIDYNQSAKTQHRARFNYNNFAGIATAGLPAFNELTPNKQRLFSYTFLHTFSSNLNYELRLAYRRSDGSSPVTTSFRFPNLDTTFPNIGFPFDLGVDIGPPGNFPQVGIENNYQVINNVTYLAGRHSFKFGGDFRNLISPQSFVQRERGDYQYTSVDYFLRDLGPDFTSQRTVGASPYYGNQRLLFAYAQDDWRVNDKLTLNLGLNYSYQEVPRGANLQALNSIASVPGLLVFKEPAEQKKNFAPKVGLAYAPDFTSGLLGRVFGSSGRSAIRAGFSLGYDYIFDNLYILALPPQANQTVDGLPYVRNFLANGGIRNQPVAIGSNAAAARLATSAFIPDQEVPYSITYTTSFQRQMGSNYALEVRYLGTRGIHLLTQNRINRQPRVSPTLAGLPTFFTRPSQTQLDALTLTLPQINTRSNFVPRYANAGFSGNSVVGFLSNGNSTYHGGSVQLTRRFSDGLQMNAAYTYSHLIDDTTAEVFSTVLSPRRVQDFQNLRAERADSALDRRHRFTLASLYELPFFKNSTGLKRALLGGFTFASTLTLESGQKATVLSGIDSNGNGDAAADRTIINPNGQRGTGSGVTALRNTAGAVVGYLANNPNAQYIQAGAGAVATAGRNTLQLPGINNVDFSIFKNFRFGERRRIQLRADFFNVFNHAQYIPGSPNDTTPIATTGVGQVNTVTSSSFNRPDLVFSSNPRVIQMALRLDF